MANQSKIKSYEKVCYVNSDIVHFGYLEDQQSASKLDHFGYFLHPNAKLVYHKSTRLRVLSRYYLNGFDLGVFASVIKNIRNGCRTVYAPSFPDIRLGVGCIKRAFPHVRILTWAWNKKGVIADQSSYKWVDYIFCLTDEAKSELIQLGYGKKAEMAYLGLDANNFNENPPLEYDILMTGTSMRDTTTALDALELRQCWHAGYTETNTQITKLLGDPQFGYKHAKVHKIKRQTPSELIRLMQTARVCWVPLPSKLDEPCGYTNLVQGLMAGCVVVIADSSILPQEVLSLKGVFQYKSESASSLISTTEKAIEYAKTTDCKADIQSNAKNTLNGDIVMARLQDSRT